MHERPCHRLNLPKLPTRLQRCLGSHQLHFLRIAFASRLLATSYFLATMDRSPSDLQTDSLKPRKRMSCVPTFAAKSVFSDSVLCLGRVLQHPDSNEAWKNRIAGVRAERSYRDYDGINGEPTEFEWNILPGFTTLQLCGKVTDLLSDLGQKPRNFHRKNFLYVNVQ